MPVAAFRPASLRAQSRSFPHFNTSCLVAPAVYRQQCWPSGRVFWPTGMHGRMGNRMSDPRLVRVSKLMSLILRHKPEQFEVILDPEGYAPVQDLVRALRKS